MTTPAARPRLLIVDDEDDFAISTSRALALEGVDCILAHDGAGALAAVQAGDCPIALLDIRIRDEDGTELAARLRAINPDLIVIIMTAYASVDSAIAAMQAGAHDFLRKPFFLNELMRALTRAFDVLRLRDEKTRAEQQLTLLRQLEATSQLAAGLSHDFRNMLTVIQANLSVLIDRLDTNPTLLPYARDAHNAAGAAASVVTRLTGFVQGRSASLSPIDLRMPVRDAVGMMRRTLCADMGFDMALPDQPLMVLADPAMIETALINLLINARDATGGHGRVTVTLTRTRQGGDYARLVVQDDGTGLSPAAARHALEPFFTTKRDGTGLGLPMIQQFALNAGGQFRLTNAPQDEAQKGGAQKGEAQKSGARAVLDLPALPLSTPPPQSAGANM